MNKLIYLFAFVILLSSVSAWSNTTFNNSLSSENLTVGLASINLTFVNNLESGFFYNFSNNLNWSYTEGALDIVFNWCAFGCDYMYLTDEFVGVTARATWTQALSQPNCNGQTYNQADSSFQPNQYICVNTTANRIALLKFQNNGTGGTVKFSWQWWDEYNSVIRYLSIPSSVSRLTSAYINLTSFTYQDFVQGSGFGTTQLMASTGNVSRLGQRIFIQNRNITRAGFYVQESGSPDGDLNVTIRYVSNDSIIQTKVLGNRTTLNSLGTIKFVNFTSTSNINDEVYINLEWNVQTPPGSGYTVLIQNSGGDCDQQPNQKAYQYGSSGYSTINSGCDIPHNFTYTDPGYPNNVSLAVSQTTGFNYTGLFNQSNNRTINLANYITNYLTASYLVGSNYMIPFIFNSQIAGILQYSSMSFSNDGFLETSQSFNNNTYETSTETFRINITYDTSRYTLPTATLVYNGTSYVGTQEGSGSDISFYKTISIPSVTSQTNKSFYWQITLNNGTGNEYYNSTFNNQTINTIGFTSCNSGNITLNFTAYDEQLLTRVSPFEFQGTFNVWIGDGSNYKNVSISNSSTAEQDICITPSNINYYINAIIQYTDVGSTNYVTRNYYFVNASLNNVTQNVSLYLLNESVSTSFILNLLDSNNLPVQDGYIYSQRYYPGENVYRTVQIAKTDTSGNSIGFFQTEVPDYKFLVLVDNVVELNTIPQKVVPTSVPYTLQFILGSTPQTPWTYFQNQSSFQYTGPSYNNNTGFITFSYIDTSGTLSYVRLLVEGLNYTGNNGVICNTNLTAVSGVLSCNVTGYSGTILSSVFLSRSPETPITLVITILGDVARSFGRLGFFMGWLIILTAAMIGIYNPTAGIVMVNVAVWLVSLAGFISFGPLFIFGLLGVSIWIVAMMNT